MWNPDIHEYLCNYICPVFVFVSDLSTKGFVYNLLLWILFSWMI